MAIIRKSELKKMSAEELEKKLAELRMELLKLNAQRAVGASVNPGRLRETKKTIARILTYLNLNRR